jgi:murein DD-endopeptidase MepM/ murein hydrolase activator NlpD
MARTWGKRTAAAALSGLLALTGVVAGAGDHGKGPKHASKPTAPNDDPDGDGIVAVVDNCTERANTLQVDSDRDGAGNACDADYDQDGRVGIDDLRRFLRVFTHHGDGLPEARFDHDGDGRVTVADLQVVVHSLGRAPGPFGDGDGDGVPAAADLCPEGLPGLPSIGLGCSVFDVAARPRTIMAPLQSGTVQLSAELAKVARLRAHDPVPPLEEAMRVLDSALESAAATELCAAERVAALADSHFQAAEEAIKTAREHMLRLGPPAGPPSTSDRGIPVYGDTSEWDSELVALDYWQGRVAKQRAQGQAVVGLLETACRETRPFADVRGSIRSIDNAQRRITLDDGRVFAMADALSLLPAPGGTYRGLSEGLEASFYGVYGSAADDRGVITSAGPTYQPIAAPPMPVVPCLRTRIAPFQRFTSYAPIEQHDPLAYFADGNYRLEAGSRIGGQRMCATPALGSRQWVRYSMQIAVTWPTGDTQILAEDFVPEQMPVPLRPGVSSFSVTFHQQTCTGFYGKPNFTPTCGAKEATSTVLYPVRNRSNWQNCTVLYARSRDQVYTVDDRDPEDHAVEQLAGFALTGDMYYDGGTVPVLEAEGYHVSADGVHLSAPLVKVLTTGDHFAIRNTDFVSRVGPTQTEFAEVIASQGVPHASGLRWPRIRGQLNGHTFIYSCAVPRVTRDAVNLCPGADDPNLTRADRLEHAYYRLPFAKGDREWTQSQGNNGDFTHSGGFAYDMRAPLDQTILAARAGRVELVQESRSVQCTDRDSCPGSNHMWVRHEDGSVGEYVHMPEDSIVPEEGDYLRRGEVVGPVGVVGFSTGPHLHFAARWDIPGVDVTRLALFEAKDPEDESKRLTCYEPEDDSGDLLLSNNEEP